MIAVETFAKVRAALLNPNARDTELSMLFERFGESVKPLAEVYSLFDGEAMWGALLPGYRLFPIRESMELADATQDAWEWIEEERGDQHPMRKFFPFLATGKKTQVGALLDRRSIFALHVVEYDYEMGLIRSWSESIAQFLDAIFSFSLDRVQPPSSAEAALGAETYTFSSEDLAYLSRWTGLSFPAHDVLEVELSSIW